MNTSGVEGEVISVPFTVENFQNVGGIQFSINFDPTLLDLVILEADGIAYPSVSSVQVDDGSGGKIDLIDVHDFSIPQEPGKVFFLWVDSEALGVSLPNDEVLFSIKFKMTCSTNKRNSWS